MFDKIFGKGADKRRKQRANLTQPQGGTNKHGSNYINNKDYLKQLDEADPNKKKKKQGTL